MADFLSSNLAGRVLFAIPKKGRLYEKCLELLAGADIQFTRSHRLDVCLVRNHNMALVFLPAADIPRFVGEGNVHLGITGQDMVAEAEMSDLVTEVLPLGFGKCKLQVQVPQRSGIQSVDQLAGKKVVTSFEVLAGRYFAHLDEKLSAQSGKRTTIEYIGGSVEAACALGLADGIESGETMRAAGLCAIETILSSQAVLIRSNRADPDAAELIERVSRRIEGVIAAGKYVLCNYNIPRKSAAEATKITPGRRAATVSPLDDPEWVAVSSMVAKAEVADVMDKLQAVGASDILVIGLDNCRV
ncbi:ATP phosphoribosyltransferase (ATP-PRTase) (ATP-PRT) [Microbotryomycetes sp. JL201]|nr:ATP phosphoribosyltransferase (ATP-PRTase) (ATP-PRT) [Microbotryomycetes sp. JL201]